MKLKNCSAPDATAADKRLAVLWYVFRTKLERMGIARGKMYLGILPFCVWSDKAYITILV